MSAATAIIPGRWKDGLLFNCIVKKHHAQAGLASVVNSTLVKVMEV